MSFGSSHFVHPGIVTLLAIMEY